MCMSVVSRLCDNTVFSHRHMIYVIYGMCMYGVVPISGGEASQMGLVFRICGVCDRIRHDDGGMLAAPQAWRDVRLGTKEKET